MKKVATITFHWATNYGAVIQAYALQKFLLDKGYCTEIIQYVPLQNMILQRLVWIKNKKFYEFKKEKNLLDFRKKNLFLSKKKYYSNKQLMVLKNTYATVISGSDQVLNFSFLQYAEKRRKTLSYYLNFTGEATDRIGYAVSFGTETIPDIYSGLIISELKKFKAIGVREQSAFSMLKKIGIDSQIVCDPTLLLRSYDYNKFIPKDYKAFEFFSFILHEHQVMAEKCIKYIIQKSVTSYYRNEALTMGEWLANERDAHFILSNSFHSTVFAIIFHTPFIVVQVSGSNMNDRITTLLAALGLEHRFLQEYSEQQIDFLMNELIEWEAVDIKLDEIRKSSQQFILKNILF